MKSLLLLLIPVTASAWVVPDSVPMCLSKTALDSLEMRQLGEPITKTEVKRIQNDCDFNHSEVTVNPHFMGTYSKVQAINYEGLRKIYFVNTRDLRRVTH